MRTPIIILAFLIFFIQNISAQTERNDKTHFALSITESYLLGNGNEFSSPGAEAGMLVHITDRVAFEARLGFMNWSDFDRLIIPLHLGTSISLLKTEKRNFGINLAAGPAANIGNDFAGFFASAETGIFTAPAENNGIVIGLRWGQSGVFHPDHFSYLKGIVGFQF